MDDELEHFIREQKAKVAEDKASLEQDPPYMEIRKSHRAYESAIKENIPPKSAAHGKEESYGVGLPLGVDYERKKQRLQHELRLDYRRYMSQKKHLDTVEPRPSVSLEDRRPDKEHHGPHPPPRQLLSEGQRSPKQDLPSRKDAATLTEGRRGVHRVLRRARGKTSCLDEEEEEEVLLATRHRGRLGRLMDQESEEEECTEEELELMEDMRHRLTGMGAGFEKRRSNKTDGRDLRRLGDRRVDPSDDCGDSNHYGPNHERERRQNPSGGIKGGRRFRTPVNKDEAEFATSLMIGAADAEEALQRRKERYRQELQEQIAEQHRNRKREKDLELKVAATGVTDPEKQPDRIRQFGLSRRKAPQVVEPPAAGEGESSGGRHSDEKLGVWDGEKPPPEQPHVAFQSPVLEYSAALGLGGGGLSPYRQPAAPHFHRAMDTPRFPLFAPHPPSTLAEAYRNPYSDTHHYYGSRNLLDPSIPYHGQLTVPGAGLPMSYWNIPPGGAIPSQLDSHSPHSQHSGSSFPEPPAHSPGRPSGEAAAVDSGAGLFPSERSRPIRERMLSYKEALKQQIQERQERRRLEREERERFEAQLEVDMKNHQPWGRGGGGAPLRDSTGNLITDLNQMHKQNEEAYSNPEQWQRRATAAMTARQVEHPDPSDRVSGFTHVHTPQFARGNVFANQPTQQQLQEQDKYKAYLKQQIEEKRRKKAEERERIRLEEEKEEKRLAEQRARIQREYEEEQERKKRKEMEQNAKNEELIQLAEQRRKEAERKRKEAEEKENASLRRQYEKERQARLEEAHREPSPPIPTLQRKHGLHRYTPRPPTADSQRSPGPLSERSLSGLESPPVPACRNQLRAAEEQRNVFNELSALRQQLRSEQKRLEGRLLQADWEELDSPVEDRHQERPLLNVFDMARLRLQAPVRRPASSSAEPRNLLRIHDSLQLKLPDGESRAGSSDVPKQDEVRVGNRTRWDYKEPHRQFSSQRTTAQDDYLDLSPPRQNHYLRSGAGDCSRGSLLESESAFIEPLGDAFPVPATPEPQRTPQLSARERRRLAKQAQPPQDRLASREPIDSPRAPDSYSHQSGSRLRREAGTNGDGRSRYRSRRLIALNRHGNTAGRGDMSDDEDNSAPLQISLHHPSHHGSEETVATDTWLRPGTSDTLKRFMGGPSRRERLMQDSTSRDWDGPSTFPS
ncbi:centrosome and spindle pole-associated protein 1-like isoform X2 [Myripristis murdjan]|uniref:centrosome and spindle pole-associated protein 1-like isoform X2 n=1 Tax=Myripristis murdjan TaxID=586833 RepID=UPI001175F0E9|nr:centrosome and spindle pole-associated protein 1-like isoform X2 [Myripristis murdjan]